MRGLTAIGMLCLTMSPWLLWVKAPISGGANPSFCFGWLAGVISGVAVIAWFSRSSKLIALCGVAGLGLGSCALLYLALIDPALWALIDENAHSVSIIAFSGHYLPGNFGVEPSFQAHLSATSAMERLAVAFYFMSWGWWTCVTGSFLILINCLTIRPRSNVRWMTIALIAVFIAHGVLLFKGVVAQYLQERGDLYLALGRSVEAIAQYDRAQRWSPQVAGSERGQLRIGEAYYRLAMPTKPQARFYLGDRYSQLGDFKTAIGEYMLASQEASVPLKLIIDKRIAWTYANRGIVQYRRGEVGAAIGCWERALAHDPAQIQVAYALAKAYFDEGRYEQSISMSRLLLARSRNQLLNANIHANIGDSYWKLKDFDRARTAYETSMRLDSHANFRIFKSLGGT